MAFVPLCPPASVLQFRGLDRTERESAAMPGDMTFVDFVKLYELPPNVPAKRFREVAVIGHTKFYELAKEGAIRLRKNGRLTTVPVEDLFQLLRGDQAAA
ncbi:hypothetical protein [Bradyrhizobium sp. SSUT77]|uniref:hypothetical protein n=1 Tax=Bradyrhizobium sp. SSUT77 TaxID=3040603 RepID=UPI002449939C|nr:hypothetical protein [Bradyrhizobium sp. SSUT77]MDH2341498.1 hypothetical protein [Bradyrhizobium sp. SSUT77]